MSCITEVQKDGHPLPRVRGYGNFPGENIEPLARIRPWGSQEGGLYHDDPSVVLICQWHQHKVI